MTDKQEQRQQLQDFLKKVVSPELPVAQLVVEAWHTLSWKLFSSACGVLLALLGVAFSLGAWWTHAFSERTASQQSPVPMQLAPKLSIVNCVSVQDISHLPEVRARLLADHIDILRQDIQAARFSRLFVIESGTLDHSYGFGWTLTTWDGAPIDDLMVSAAYLDQEIEGHESFSPLHVVRNKQRFRVGVPEVRASARLIVLVALSGHTEIPDECTHVLKASNE